MLFFLLIYYFPTICRQNILIAGFIASPTPKVVADIIVHGIPNKSNLPSSIITKLDQSPTKLLKGSLMAIEAVTEMVEDSDIDIDQIRNQYEIHMKDLVTKNCQEKLAEYCTSMLTNSYNKNTKKDIHLVFTPEDDIFFAWIGKLEGKVKVPVLAYRGPPFIIST